MRRLLTTAMGGGACLGLLLVGYVAKRKLGIDVFPGYDTLPDAQIKAMVLGALALFTLPLR